MPPRLVSLAILLYWSAAAFLLLTREVLPELTLGYPPDLRAIAAATVTPTGEDSTPVAWNVLVVDDPFKPDERRSVGKVVTRSSRSADGGYELKSEAQIDAHELMSKTPWDMPADVQLGIESVYHVRSTGNLSDFTMKVRLLGWNDEIFRVDGRVDRGMMKVKSHGDLPMLTREFEPFPYEERGVVLDALRPIERLPGLQVGQRWDMKVVSPLPLPGGLKAVETVRVEVKRRDLTVWDGETVPTFLVEQNLGAFTSRTWVRPDGLILRQEVPLPLLKLMLERVPDASSRTSEKDSKSGGGE